ncbi:endo alpha-1,4 polygalactosaminidase [Flavobacterium sp.]|uniref:endo alpha-1,4 polygalactosaminidase n=1 Tax=Flavobacterium sp. TaxID=239 RepID=UPI00286BF04A|nr:endo alpha-1,4 polygalactosaminidase [Flavobacterium sp.]
MRKKSLFILSLFVLFIVAFTPVKESKTTKAGIKMQDFVIDLSKYARSIDSTFIIIPQNGPELAFEKMNPNGKLRTAYIDAIDGIAVEDLFYNEKPKVDTYRLNMLRKLKAKKQIMLSDFIREDNAIESIKSQSDKEGFLLYPRVKTNEHYREIPTNIPNENANDILKLSDAKNYLYLINPIDLKTKHLFLTAIAATNYDMITIDLFYNDRLLTANEIEKLKTKANGGKRLIISYVNIGAVENWRYYWKTTWQINNPIWIKKKYAGYDDEFYVQFWHEDWKKIIYGNPDSYVKKIIDAGFDGAFLDNVEGYYFLYNK